jgi:ABC-type uncharacterized transport system ATPase component
MNDEKKIETGSEKEKTKEKEKKKLTVEDLLAKFSEASGEEFSNDRMMLAK